VEEDKYPPLVSGEVDAIWNMVDRVLYRHGCYLVLKNVQDPLLIPLSVRTDELRMAYKKRPLDRLPEDVTHAFDRLSSCERQRDKLQLEVLRLNRRLDSANLKLWILGSAVLAEAGVISWLASALFSRLH